MLAGHSLAPFTVNQHCGFCTNTMHGQTQDVKFAGKWQVFRIIVLNVHGKVVVIYVESLFSGTTARQRQVTKTIFATFVPYAEKMLKHISFDSP